MKATKKKKIRSKITFKRVLKYCFWLVIAGLITFTVLTAFSIKNKFESTKKWDNKPDSVVMADQSIDSLYDRNPVSIQAKKDFNALYDKMVDKTGDLTNDASEKNLKKLNSFWTNIDKNKLNKVYKDKIDDINSKKSIQKSYFSLFEDKDLTTLSETVNPDDINKVYLHNKDALSKLFNKNPEDAFVARMYLTVKNLSDDSNAINAIISEYNKAVTQNSDKTVIINQGYFNDFDGFLHSQISTLHYKWKSLDHIKSVAEEIKEPLSDLRDQNTSYTEYQQDLNDKSQSYKDWNNEKVRYEQQKQQEYQDTVNQVKKRQQEEADRQAKQKQQEEADRKKQEDEQKKKDEEDNKPKPTPNSSDVTTNSSDKVPNSSN